MAFAGVLMLAAVVLAAGLLARSEQTRRRWALAAPVILAALAVSYVRNAWIGLAAAILILAALARPRALPALILAGGCSLALAPPEVQLRFASSFDWPYAPRGTAGSSSLQGTRCGIP